MGLFSSKKKTYVSSVVYNMAGDVAERPHYRKTITSAHVLGNSGRTYTREALDSYLKGPGINLRRFGLWARTQGYNANVGAVNSTFNVIGSIDTDTLTAQLTSMFGRQVYVNEASIGNTDYGMWAAQYVLANYPDRYLEEWSADFVENTGQIVVHMRGMSPITFMPAGYVPFSQYLYVSMNQERPASSSSEFSDWRVGAGPSRAQYVQSSTSSATVDVPLMSTTTVVQTVEGEDPVTEVFEVPHSHEVRLNGSVWTRRTNLPEAPSSMVVGDVTYSISLRENYVIDEVTTSDELVEELETGTRTTTMTRVDQVVRKITEYQTGTVMVREKAWANEQIYIYRRNSGNPVLDSLFTGAQTAGTFFPIIPVRIENQFISEQAYPHLLPWVKKAMRRATNHSFEKLVEMVSDNANLSDIDFAYVVFGASLNSPENTAKRYIYEFFRNAGLAAGTEAMEQFWTDYNAAVASWDAWVLWYTSGRYANSNEYGWTDPIPEPVRLPMPSLPAQSVTVAASVNYNINLTFSGVSETIHSGVYAPGAKRGDLRIYKSSSEALVAYPEQLPDDNGNYARWNRVTTGSVQGITIDWQTGPNTFRRLQVDNPVHTNNVYGGKSVVITAWEALDDPDESGFIIPLQDETLRSLPIPVATQLCTASTYMMFNCYTIVKQKWYQTGLFAVIVLIIAIVIAVWSGVDTTSFVSGGMLGSNVAVGTAIGFSGTAAIVAGAIANAIVSMIVTQIISRVSTSVFGDKFGSLIGAIVSIAVINVGSQMAGGQTLSLSFGNMMTAENLLKLTSALSDGVTSYIQSSTVEIQQQTAGVLQDYQEQAKALSEKFMADFGGTGIIDPLQISGVSAFKLEAPSVFLDRTLMNGTDIAEMSHTMLDNFAQLTVTLPLE